MNLDYMYLQSPFSLKIRWEFIPANVSAKKQYGLDWDGTRTIFSSCAWLTLVLPQSLLIPTWFSWFWERNRLQVLSLMNQAIKCLMRWTLLYFNIVRFQKITIPTDPKQGNHWKFREGGVLKSQNFKTPLWRVWIFSGTTHFDLIEAAYKCSDLRNPLFNGLIGYMHCAFYSFLCKFYVTHRISMCIYM